MTGQLVFDVMQMVINAFLIYAIYKLDEGGAP